MIYVDFLVDNGWKLGPNCHLFADTKDELITFAMSIGLKEQWIQTSKNGWIHFDLTENKRKIAIKTGAKEFKTRKEVVEFLKRM